MMERDTRKTYLGDGVEISLEFEVYNALIQYACRVWPGGE